jgi:23S rRNA (pseudouridine1915-N3)-methyltransferase
LKITLFYIGKPRSREANLLSEDYAARIARFCRFEMVQLRNEREAEKQSGKALRVILDPAGDELRSEELARLVEGAGRDIAFFVGGADGFSEEFRKSAERLLSLSRMTLPHELARVILAEQIYRAFTILRNHPYPR